MAYSIRAVVESRVRSVNRAFPGSKLPVRGLIQAHMVLYAAALLVNLRSLHRHSKREAEEETAQAATYLFLLKVSLLRRRRPISCHYAMLLSARHSGRPCRIQSGFLQGSQYLSLPHHADSDLELLVVWVCANAIRVRSRLVRAGA